MNTTPVIKACVFDAYGTLFDVHSAVARHRERLGDRAAAVSALWRTKQLEYTWLRSLMGRYTDFSKVTADALDYALDTHDVTDASLRDALLEAYLSLDCYPEVPGVLGQLSRAGMTLAILSNGSPAMIEAAVASSGLSDAFDALISVDPLRRYKPDPAVYQLACDRFDVPPGEIMFQSSNAWDAAGAKAFGFRVTWVNRFAQRPERLGLAADHEVTNLEPLPALVGAGG
ncbi:MAG: haloacid dehalogenase type II [Gammaproteobacteria bacterium]|nr:haloacid dehalogenase type II [Gammaproteobacteria bacterium]